MDQAVERALAGRGDDESGREEANPRLAAAPAVIRRDARRRGDAAGAMIRSGGERPRSATKAVAAVAASSLALLAALASLTLPACSSRAANLDPVLPEAVGELTRTESPGEAAGGTWTFTASIEGRQAHYSGEGARRLTIYAFLFPTPTVAHDTYETSRRTLLGGGGGFAKAAGAQIAGVHGMRMTDAAGDYFEFQRGCWVVILEGSGNVFDEAVRAIRWEAAAGPE
jgi:hypothetical protein